MGHAHLTQQERDDLHGLREKRRARRQARQATKCTLSQRAADRVAAIVGSWNFIIIQSVLLVIWMMLNIVAWVKHWDPYPFVLLNLVLSFQAAFTAPIIMMSQNRQSELDRHEAHEDFEVNRKAELEIEALHEKLDVLREQEISKLTAILEKLVAEKTKDA